MITRGTISSRRAVTFTRCQPRAVTQLHATILVCWVDRSGRLFRQHWPPHWHASTRSGSLTNCEVTLPKTDRLHRGSLRSLQTKQTYILHSLFSQSRKRWKQHLLTNSGIHDFSRHFYSQHVLDNISASPVCLYKLWADYNSECPLIHETIIDICAFKRNSGGLINNRLRVCVGASVRNTPCHVYPAVTVRRKTRVV
jgi:hypothetical protein